MLHVTRYFEGSLSGFCRSVHLHFWLTKEGPDDDRGRTDFFRAFFSDAGKTRRSVARLPHVPAETRRAHLPRQIE